tara:strand:- start:2781 stop:3746 length:966 start_codon:yes stop_codon:yes gene_type:complete
MAFLDNSGDIILDAVLTDAGRQRLARGDGTFKVTKYAFGDDEINYGSYNPNHTSGSAYFDLEILQTPILEAFTNNRSSLKSRLITLTNNNLLYLPQLVLNENTNQPLTVRTPTTALSSNSFLISVNSDTEDELNTDTTIGGKFLKGNKATGATDNHIRVDQGLTTTKLNPDNQLNAELLEQQYIIEIDNRLGTITDAAAGGTIGSFSFVDDDQIATYYVTRNVGSYVTLCKTGPLEGVGGEPGAATTPDYEVIAGPRGTRLRFGVMASSNLKHSDHLFDTIGSTATLDTKNYKLINTTIKVTGVTTGYHIDVPVTFAKLTT